MCMYEFLVKWTESHFEYIDGQLATVDVESIGYGFACLESLNLSEIHLNNELFHVANGFCDWH